MKTEKSNCEMFIEVSPLLQHWYGRYSVIGDWTVKCFNTECKKDCRLAYIFPAGWLNPNRDNSANNCDFWVMERNKKSNEYEKSFKLDFKLINFFGLFQGSLCDKYTFAKDNGYLDD